MPPSPVPRARLARLLLAPVLVVLGTGCAALGHVAEPASVVRGPLPIRSQHPLNQTFLAFRPRGAGVLAKGESAVAAHLAYSSIFEVDSVPGPPGELDAVAFDGETARFSARWRRGLGDGFDLEIELPFTWAGGGFLDPFVESWHDFFALANQGRELAEENDFDMRLVKDGAVIYRREGDELGLADVPIVVTRALRTEDEHGAGLALRAGIELPVGSRSSGRGNGELDAGLGLVGERTSGRWTSTWALDLVFTGRPPRFSAAGIDAEDVLDVQAGVEYRWSHAVSLLADLVVTSPIVDAIELEEIDSPILEFAAGLAIDGPRGSVWHVAFQEDLLAAAGADFTVFVGWASRL